VDVTSKRDEPDIVEHDWFGRHSAVKRELEFFRGRKRIDVVADIVAVRKHDRRANLNGSHVGDELFITLIDHGLRFREPGRGAVSLSKDNRVRNGGALRVPHRHVERACSEVFAKRNDREQSNCAKQLHLVSEQHFRCYEMILVLQRIVQGHGIIIIDLERNVLRQSVNGRNGNVMRSAQQFVGS
jgi:hypothetical protein